MDKDIRTSLVVSKTLLKELQEEASKEGFKLERFSEKVIRAGLKALATAQGS